MNFGAAVAAVRENVAFGACLFRQDQPEALLDHRSEWPTGLLRMSFCPGQQIVMDVKRRFHDTHTTHRMVYGQYISERKRLWEVTQIRTETSNYSAHYLAKTYTYYEWCDQIC